MFWAQASFAKKRYTIPGRACVSASSAFPFGALTRPHQRTDKPDRRSVGRIPQLRDAEAPRQNPLSVGAELGAPTPVSHRRTDTTDTFGLCWIGASEVEALRESRADTFFRSTSAQAKSHAT
jgi:hypothetical protein